MLIRSAPRTRIRPLIAEVIQEPDLELNAGKRTVDQVDGGIRLAKASHRYAGADSDALHEIDLDITPGETVALVGPSGSGKSTLLNLVLGFVARRAAGSCSTAPTCKTSTCARPADSSRSCRRSPCCSRARSARTSHTGCRMPTRSAFCRRCATPTRSNSSRRCPRAGTPSWASAARASRAGSASGSRSPGRWCATPGCCCSTRRPRRWTRSRRSS